MEKIDFQQKDLNIAKRLCGVATSDSTILTDQVAQIRLFLMNIKRFSQTPEFIHMILKFEYNLTFRLDTYNLKDYTKEQLDSLLLEEWPNDIFFVIDHSCIEEWLSRIMIKWKDVIEQKRTMRSVWVLLLPSRTSSQWFHNYILPNAKEIRFLKGSTIIPSMKPTQTIMPNDKEFSDAYCICIFDSFNGTQDISLEPEPEPRVSMIHLGTRFTDDDTEIKIKTINNINDE